MSVDTRYEAIDPAEFVTAGGGGTEIWSKEGTDNWDRATFRVATGNVDVQVYVGAPGVAPQWCDAEAFPLLNEHDAAAYANVCGGATTIWTLKGKFSGIRFRMNGGNAVLGELTFYNE